MLLCSNLVLVEPHMRGTRVLGVCGLEDTAISGSVAFLSRLVVLVIILRHPLPHRRGETDDSVEASGVGQPRDRQKIKRQKGTTHKRREMRRTFAMRNATHEKWKEQARIRKSREKSGTIDG